MDLLSVAIDPQMRYIEPVRRKSKEPKSKRRRVKSFRLMWITICLMGTILQVIEVSNVYFSYKITTLVNMEYPDFIQRPSLTICFYTAEIYDWNRVGIDELKHLESAKLENASKILESPEILLKVEEQIRNDGFGEKIKYTGIVNDGLTAEQIMARSVSHSGIILGCAAISNRDYRYRPDAQCANHKATTYVREMQKCFRLDSVNESSDQFNYMFLNQMVSQGFFYQFKVNGSHSRRISNVMYSFLPRGRFLRNGYIRFIMKETLEVSLILSYSIYRSEMLPYPYETRCIDYPDYVKKSGLELHQQSHHLRGTNSTYTIDAESIMDGGDCWEQCVILNSIRHFGRISPGVSVVSSLKIPLITEYEVESNKTLRDLDVRIKHQCNTLCKWRACDSSTFIPQLVSSKDRSLSGKKSQKVIVNVMSQPQTYAKAVQKMNFIEYASYLATAIGFWFGFTVLEAGNKFATILMPCIKSSLKNRLYKSRSDHNNLKRSSRSRNAHRDHLVALSEKPLPTRINTLLPPAYCS